MITPDCPPPVKGELEGVFCVSYREDLVAFARKNRKNPTSAEKVIWNILCRNQFAGLKFTRQKPLKNFIVDFYCAALRLAIEVDGDSHAQQDSYDALRTAELEKKCDIKVIRYDNSDVLGNLEGVYHDLVLQTEERCKQLRKPPLSPP